MPGLLSCSCGECGCGYGQECFNILICRLHQGKSPLVAKKAETVVKLLQGGVNAGVHVVECNAWMGRSLLFGVDA
jgi:hypothetical protein